MASLADMYTESLLEDLEFQKGWMVNWPPYFIAELGDVGSLVRDSDTGRGSLRGGNKLSDVVDRDIQSEVGTKGKRSFTSGSSTSVAFGIDATVPGWEWIRGAKAGVHASFGRTGGMAAEASGLRHERISDLEGLRVALLAAAKSGAMRVGHAIIVERDRADSGLVLASEDTSGDLKATTNADVGPGTLSLVSFAADITVKSQSGREVTYPLPEPFTTAYRILKVGTRGIWWWKKIDILGITEMSPEQGEAAAEDALDESDYFARFDDT